MWRPYIFSVFTACSNWLRQKKRLFKTAMADGYLNCAAVQSRLSFREHITINIIDEAIYYIPIQQISVRVNRMIGYVIGCVNNSWNILTCQEGKTVRYTFFERMDMKNYSPIESLHGGESRKKKQFLAKFQLN